MAQPIIFQYQASVEQTIEMLILSVTRLGYTLTSADKQIGLVNFETGISLRSWAGQKLSAHVLDIGDEHVYLHLTPLGNKL
jgi:hypothetical protein